MNGNMEDLALRYPEQHTELWDAIDSFVHEACANDEDQWDYTAIWHQTECMKGSWIAYASSGLADKISWDEFQLLEETAVHAYVRGDSEYRIWVEKPERGSPEVASPEVRSEV